MPYSAGDKLFAAFTATMSVILGIACLLAAAHLAILIWQAGFIMVLLWVAILTAFFYACRVLYRVIIKNEWI